VLNVMFNALKPVSIISEMTAKKKKMNAGKR